MMRQTLVCAKLFIPGDHYVPTTNKAAPASGMSAAYASNMDVIRFFDRLCGAVDKRPLTTWVPNQYRDHTLEFEGITPRNWLHKKAEDPISDMFPYFDRTSDFNFKAGGGLGVKQSLWINLSVAVSLQLLNKDCPEEPLALPSLHSSSQSPVQALQEGYACLNNRTVMVHCSQFDHSNVNSRDNLLHYLETSVSPYHFRFNAVTGVLLPARLQPVDKEFAGRHLTKPEFEIRGIRAKHTQQDQVQMHSLWVSAEDFERLNLQFRAGVRDGYEESLRKFKEQKASMLNSRPGHDLLLAPNDDLDELSSLPKRTDLRIRRANRKISAQSEEPVIEDRGEKHFQTKQTSMQPPPEMLYFHLSLIEEGVDVIRNLEHKERVHPVNTSYFIRGNLTSVQAKPMVEIEVSRGYQTVVPPDLAPRLAAFRAEKGYFSRFWSSEKAAGEEITLDFVGMGSVYRQNWWNGDDFLPPEDISKEKRERTEAINSGVVSSTDFFPVLSEASSKTNLRTDLPDDPQPSFDEIPSALLRLDVEKLAKRKASLEQAIDALRTELSNLKYEKDVNATLTEMHDVAQDVHLALKSKGVVAETEFKMRRSMKRITVLLGEHRQIQWVIKQHLPSEGKSGPAKEIMSSSSEVTSGNSKGLQTDGFDVAEESQEEQEQPCLVPEPPEEDEESKQEQESIEGGNLGNSLGKSALVDGHPLVPLSGLSEIQLEEYFSRFCRESLFGRSDVDSQDRLIGIWHGCAAEPLLVKAVSDDDTHRYTFQDQHSEVLVVYNCVEGETQFESAIRLVLQDIQRQKEKQGICHQLPVLAVTGQWSKKFWNTQSTEGKIAVLALSAGKYCCIFRLSGDIPKSLCSLLQNKAVVKVAVDAVALRDQIYRNYEIPIGPVLDLRPAAAVLWPIPKSTPKITRDAFLASLIKITNDIELSRSRRILLSNWSLDHHFSSEQLEYVADGTRGTFLTATAILERGFSRLRTLASSKDTRGA